MFIYKITNLVNEKAYIGLTRQTIKIRYNRHWRDSKTKDTPLYRSMRKHGREKFKIEQIYMAAPDENLEELENQFMEKFNTFIENGRGFNISRGGYKNIKTFKNYSYKKYASKYTGVYKSNNNKNQWCFIIELDNGKTITRHGFDTEKDCSVARDLQILKNFELQTALHMLNFPENVNLYTEGKICSPKRNLKKSEKFSIYPGVRYVKKSDLWHSSLKDKNGVVRYSPKFKEENDAIIAHDLLSLHLFGGEAKLHFPENLQRYINKEFKIPFLRKPRSLQTFARKYVRFLSPVGYKTPTYRIEIMDKGKKYFFQSSSLEKTLEERNLILLSIGRPIPD